MFSEFFFLFFFLLSQKVAMFCLYFKYNIIPISLIFQVFLHGSFDRNCSSVLD